MFSKTAFRFGKCRWGLPQVLRGFVVLFLLSVCIPQSARADRLENSWASKSFGRDDLSSYSFGYGRERARMLRQLQVQQAAQTQQRSFTGRLSSLAQRVSEWVSSWDDGSASAAVETGMDWASSLAGSLFGAETAFADSGALVRSQGDEVDYSDSESIFAEQSYDLHGDSGRGNSRRSQRRAELRRQGYYPPERENLIERF